jgi:hypothetical protein
LDDRKHRNAGVMRSVAGIKNYSTSCQAFEQIYETLAFPETINMDKEAEPTVVSDDEADIQEQVIVAKELPSNDTSEEQKDEEQMREEPKEIKFEDDTQVDEEQPVYADD